jgi:CHAT domain-containing protein
MQQHSERPAEAINALAFHVSERARARTLLELLSEAHINLQHGVSADLIKRESELRRLLSAKAEQYTRVLNSQHTAEQAKAAAKEIESAEMEYQQVRAKIRSSNPHYASLMQPRPPSVTEIQATLLDSDTLLLEYALGDERSYVWALTTTSMSSYELPGRASIEAEVRRAYDLLTARNSRKSGETTSQRLARWSQAENEYVGAGARLSGMLLGPVASHLGSKRLLIVSDGALQYFPFSALPDPAHISGERQTAQPLVVNHEIVNLPSASTLAVLRQETADRPVAEKTIAVFADPVFEAGDPRVKRTARRPAIKTRIRPWSTNLEQALRDIGVIDEKNTLSRLPFSREEAKEIVSAAPIGERLMRLDFGANLSAVKSGELSRYRIIHFATHGILNTQNPTLSGVVLSLVNEQGEPQDGFLRLHDIYNLDLAAELVVLSACQTGLGKQVRGEGLIGLTRGFMYAGSKRDRGRTAS